MDHCELSHAIRNLAIALLNDEYGINNNAIAHLRSLIEEYGHTDILEALEWESCHNRYYITEHAANALIQEL